MESGRRDISNVYISNDGSLAKWWLERSYIWGTGMKIIALYGKGRSDKRTIANALFAKRKCHHLRMEDVVIDIISRQNPVIATSGSKVQSLLQRFGVEHCLTKYKELREMVASTSKVLKEFFGPACILNLLSHDKMRPIAELDEDACFVISDFENIEDVVTIEKIAAHMQLDLEVWYAYKEFGECPTDGIEVSKKIVNSVSIEKLEIAALAAFDGKAVESTKRSAKTIN